MKIQHLDAEYADKQNTYKICALKPKKISKKEGNSEIGQGMEFPPKVSDEEEKTNMEHPLPNEDNQMKKESKVQELNPQVPMHSQSAKILDTMDTSGSK